MPAGVPQSARVPRAQGFYLARPMPAEAISELLVQRAPVADRLISSSGGSVTRSRARLFMQKRCPVGAGPSGNRWPRWEPHRRQRTSVRTMPWLTSSISSTASAAFGLVEARPTAARLELGRRVEQLGTARRAVVGAIGMLVRRTCRSTGARYRRGGARRTARGSGLHASRRPFAQSQASLRPFSATPVESSELATRQVAHIASGSGVAHALPVELFLDGIDVGRIELEPGVHRQRGGDAGTLAKDRAARHVARRRVRDAVATR